MIVKVKLFATLTTGRFHISDIELDAGTKIIDLIRKLNINEKDAAIIFINGIHAEFNTVIKGDDEIAIFPPIGGG